MIFIDKMRSLDNILNPEFVRLINLALKNQSHVGDLLLIHINGFYDETIENINVHSVTKYNPHVIGPGSEGHSELTHYSFINKYRTTYLASLPYSEYLKLHVYSPERSKEIDELVEIEETSIQLEMLVYLKFWEADMIIKKFYQFARILNGEPYDWYFNIRSDGKSSTGIRQNIIRVKFRERLKKHSQIVYDLIKDTYKTQIRNSIAHSNYSTIGRNIRLNNFIVGNKYSNLKSISFDNWVDIFHNTMALYNQYINFNNEINKIYAFLVKDCNNEMKIRITEKDGKQYEHFIQYNPATKDWNYKVLDKK